MALTNVTIFYSVPAAIALESWLQEGGACDVTRAGDTFNGSWPAGMLRITHIQRKQPGDAFSKLALGLYAWTQNAAVAVDRDALLRRVSDVDFAFGIVAEPGLTESDRRADAIFGLAETVSGLLFTGSELIAPSGEALASQ